MWSSALPRTQVVIVGELFAHPDVRDAIGERRDDGFIRGLRDLVAHLGEALNVLAEGLARALLHAPQVIDGGGYNCIKCPLSGFGVLTTNRLRN